MADFFQIDFLDVETDSSGDSIALRYEIAGQQMVHLVDGGYQVTGPKIVEHINTYYGTNRIDHLVVTHCDQDHTGGLAHVLETMKVGALWMLRPWLYAEELLPRFVTYNDASRLRSRLRSIYAKLVALEEAAIACGVPIYDPFQGQSIGAFVVLAPSRARYLDLIVASERTPESVGAAELTDADRRYWLLKALMKKAVTLVVSAWNHELFSTEETSAENEMSVVQTALLSTKRVVLTGDAGRGALTEAADFAPLAGLHLPGVDRMQIPHHGSRRNVSTALLDRWLGQRFPSQLPVGQERSTAIVSSAKADEKHPRKAVVRAFMHRGAQVVATESRTICISGGEPPDRGWGAVAGEVYPTIQEE